MISYYLMNRQNGVITLLTLGQRIKAKRKEKKLTQIEVAKRLGIDNTTVSKWESDVYEPDAEALVKLAELFDTTSDYLLGRTDDPKPPKTDMKDDSPIPSSVQAWLRADTTGLTEEEQRELAKELADYFEMRKRRILEKKGILKEND